MPDATVVASISTTPGGNADVSGAAALTVTPDSNLFAVNIEVTYIERNVQKSVSFPMNWDSEGSFTGAAVLPAGWVRVEVVAYYMPGPPGQVPIPALQRVPADGALTRPFQPPNAAADAAATLEATGVTVNVLANDTDPLGSSLAVDAVTQAAHGTVTMSSGSVSYTPAAGFVGTDSFTYTVIDDETWLATASVTVTVTANGTVSGKVWDDGWIYYGTPYDMDGQQAPDESDAGYGGLTVTLYNAQGTAVASTTTNSYGYYSFNGLVSGQYSVGFELPADFGNQSYQFSTGSGSTALFTLEANATVDVDAGVYWVLTE